MFAGTPLPTSKWTKNGKEMQLTDSAKTEQQPDKCKLTIDKADRKDGGDYKLELKNASGETSVPITLKILDRPTSPGGPLEVTEVYSNRCKLSWKPVDDDGGSPLEHYLVEKKEGRGPWEEVGKVHDTQCGVTSLKAGAKYKFRVKGVNSEGESKPLETAHEVVAKDPWDPPSAPGKPVVVDYDKNYAKLEWTKPKSDGGNSIKKYIVQRKPKYGDWEDAKTIGPDDLSTTIDNLPEGKEFQFRVVPVNDAGKGEASSTTEQIQTKARRVKPRIDRNSFEPTKRLKAGQPLLLSVEFVGEPSPSATWSQSNKVDIFII